MWERGVASSRRLLLVVPPFGGHRGPGGDGGAGRFQLAGPRRRRRPRSGAAAAESPEGSAHDTSRKKPEDLRSHRWLGVQDLRSFGHRSRLRQIGYDAEDWRGKPVIGIINTWSDINACHAHLRARAEDVKRGVLQAGGFPLELPAISLAEPFVKPTTMLYRNFLAMETEELLRSHPIDGAVLLGGCDKTTPGLLMGAISMGLPAIYLPGRPDAARQLARAARWARAPTCGNTGTRSAPASISEADWSEMEDGIARSFGTCMTMGTAATMMAIAEAMGLTLPGASSLPAADAGHPRMCAQAGRRIVEMVWEDLTPDKILTAGSFENAIRVHMAMGGSTNAIIHVVAMARRAGIALSLEQFDQISRTVPVIANIRPSGEYLMEDFFYAGGLPALMKMLGERCTAVPDRQRPHARREHRAGRGVQRRRDPPARQGHLRRRRDGRAAAAISRRAVP